MTEEMLAFARYKSIALLRSTLIRAVISPRRFRVASMNFWQKGSISRVF